MLGGRASEGGGSSPLLYEPTEEALPRLSGLGCCVASLSWPGSRGEGLWGVRGLLCLLPGSSALIRRCEGSRGEGEKDERREGSRGEE